MEKPKKNGKKLQKLETKLQVLWKKYAENCNNKKNYYIVKKVFQ